MFVTKASHIVIMEFGCGEHKQPGEKMGSARLNFALVTSRITDPMKKTVEETVDRRKGGKTILRSGQGWTLLAQLGQLRAGQGGKGLL